MFFLGPDALGRPVRLEAAPHRIVSLVPSQTELLADLGLGAEVVGLTRFCVHPAGWKAEKRIVGGTKNVRTDRVAELRPDLILANKEENVREQVEALAELAPVYVTDVQTVSDAAAMIRTVGRLTNREAEGQRLAREVEAGFETLPGFEPARAAYLIWREPWMAVGRDTIIHDVMRRASFENVFGDRDRYPEVTLKALREARPDVVLLSSEPFPFGAPHVAEVEAMVPDAHVVLVDGEAFSWYGSRLRRTPAYLRDLRQRVARG